MSLGFGDFIARSPLVVEDVSSRLGLEIVRFACYRSACPIARSPGCAATAAVLVAGGPDLLPGGDALMAGLPCLGCHTLRPAGSGCRAEVPVVTLVSREQTQTYSRDGSNVSW